MRHASLFAVALTIAGCGPVVRVDSRSHTLENTVNGHDSEAAIERARRAVATRRGVAESDVAVELLGGARVPALSVFRTELRSRRGHRGSYNVGIIAGDEVELDPRRAVERVLRAWRYDAARPVAAAQVAEVVGFLQGGSTTATAALVEPERIAALPAEWRPHVFLPRETTVDGAPAIVYWIAGSFLEDTEPPLWRVELAVPAGGEPVLRIDSIAALLRDDDGRPPSSR